MKLIITSDFKFNPNAPEFKPTASTSSSSSSSNTPSSPSSEASTASTNGAHKATPEQMFQHMYAEMYTPKKKKK